MHKYVFISDWQYQRYQLVHGVPYDNKSIVLESGIEPASKSCLEKNYDKIRLCYTSTPQRGLEILVPVFSKLTEKYGDRIHLDVFSSFKIYGWDEMDKQYQPLYDEINNHPCMTYRGFVANEELKSYLNSAHIHAYPSIWPETSCRAMLEAMSAGLVCVHPNYGALPETSGGLNMMYHGDYANRNLHALEFMNCLDAAIEMVDNRNHLNSIQFNKEFVDGRYNINRIKGKWESMLKALIEKYPTIESRKQQKAMFRYTT